MKTDGLKGVLEKLRSDMVSKLDPTFPKAFGAKAYTERYLPWTGPAVGIYPANELGYILEDDAGVTVAWVAVDIDCGPCKTLTATIPYFDAFSSFIRHNYSDITISKAFVDIGAGPKNDQGLVSVLLRIPVEYPNDRGMLGQGNAPKFI